MSLSEEPGGFKHRVDMQGPVLCCWRLWKHMQMAPGLHVGGRRAEVSCPHPDLQQPTAVIPIARQLSPWRVMCQPHALFLLMLPLPTYLRQVPF